MSVQPHPGYGQGPCTAARAWTSEIHALRDLRLREPTTGPPAHHCPACPAAAAYPYPPQPYAQQPGYVQQPGYAQQQPGYPQQGYAQQPAPTQQYAAPPPAPPPAYPPSQQPAAYAQPAYAPQPVAYAMPAVPAVVVAAPVVQVWPVPMRSPNVYRPALKPAVHIAAQQTDPHHAA